MKTIIFIAVKRGLIWAYFQNLNKGCMASIISSQNIHSNVSNLIINTFNKNSNVLFNNTSSNQIKNDIIDNQFNKSNKILLILNSSISLI